jgi:hypothetical protein
MQNKGTSYGVIAAIVFSLVVVAASRAQNYEDQGDYQILSARYGTAERNIDVTARLKELARQDRTFRMGNSTFGSDPVPGRIKMLRIYARGPNGRNRVFEYQEGSTIDGTMFTGWGGGNWAQGEWNGAWGDADIGDGDYQILSARYGTPNRNIDVTARLQDLARQDRTFRMGNSTFGGDPDPGHIKTLRIYARGPNGRNRMFEYQEGSIVDGNLFTGWRGGNWGQSGWNGGWEFHEEERRNDRSSLFINEATYGANGRNHNVTERLRTLIRDGYIEIKVDNSSMGGDPAPNSHKTLWVAYTVNGQRQETRVNEGERLRIP